jgi:hypothetical protein
MLEGSGLWGRFGIFIGATQARDEQAMMTFVA